MRNDCCPVVRPGELDTLQRLAESANLVDLNQNRIRYAQLNSFTQKLCIGDKEIVANQLDALSNRFSQTLPAIPIVFGHAIFNRNDRVLAGPVLPEGSHLIARKPA